MSWWGTLEAEFKGGPINTAEVVADDAPQGSEHGVSIWDTKGTIHVSGRLRDVTDVEDSAAVLAWFVKHARWSDHASLLWELDNGPRYRYEWHGGELHKLKGILDL